MRRAILASLFGALTLGTYFVAEAFQPTLAFWQTGSQVFATVNSADLMPQISNDLRARSVPVGGWGIIEYKAVVITSGTCTSPGVDASLLSAPTSSSTLPFTFTPPADTVDAYFTVCVIGKNFVGVWQRETTPTSSYTLHINTELPAVNSITLNNGTSPTPKARVPISLSMTHPRLKVTHFCLKSRLSAVALPTPTNDDACWYAVNNPSPGKTPSPAVSFSGFVYNLGFSTGDYFVYAWAKAESGAVSYLTSLGNGTFGTDKETIRFVQGSPPVIINAQATANDSPADPVSDADLTIPAGQTVVIKWNASDDRPLPSDSISLSYTIDENSFTQIASSLSNSAHAGCTLDSRYTGCYVWTNGSPRSSYFKIRVSATDDSMLEASASAVPNNATPFRVIAGNTDPGLNSSASAAIIFPKASDQSPSASNAGCLAVTDDGVVYTVDRRGLMRIDVNDGRYRQYIPVTGSTNVGPVSSATLRIRPRRIALDYNDGLLIYDYEQILRLDLKTEVLSVFIGGGSTLADNTPATSYAFTAPTNFDAATTLMPLPNGIRSLVLRRA